MSDCEALSVLYRVPLHFLFPSLCMPSGRNKSSPCTTATVLIRTGGVLTLLYKMGSKFLLQALAMLREEGASVPGLAGVSCKAVLKSADSSVCLSPLLLSLEFHSEITS